MKWVTRVTWDARAQWKSIGSELKIKQGDLDVSYISVGRELHTVYPKAIYCARIILLTFSKKSCCCN